MHKAGAAQTMFWQLRRSRHEVNTVGAALPTPTQLSAPPALPEALLSSLGRDLRRAVRHMFPHCVQCDKRENGLWPRTEIVSASCRASVCQYVSISWVTASSTNNTLYN